MTFHGRACCLWETGKGVAATCVEWIGGSTDSETIQGLKLIGANWQLLNNSTGQWITRECESGTGNVPARLVISVDFADNAFAQGQRGHWLGQFKVCYQGCYFVSALDSEIVWPIQIPGWYKKIEGRCSLGRFRQWPLGAQRKTMALCFFSPSSLISQYGCWYSVCSG